MVIFEWNGIRSRYMLFLRQNSSKNPKNHAGSRKAAKESKQLGGQGDARSFVPGSTAVPPPPRAARGGGCPG